MNSNVSELRPWRADEVTGGGGAHRSSSKAQCGPSRRHITYNFSLHENVLKVMVLERVAYLQHWILVEIKKRIDCYCTQKITL